MLKKESEGKDVKKISHLPINFTRPEDSNAGSSFFTLFTESSTNSLIWSIPTTCPLGPTSNRKLVLNYYFFFEDPDLIKNITSSMQNLALQIMLSKMK